MAQRSKYGVVQRSDVVAQLEAVLRAQGMPKRKAHEAALVSAYPERCVDGVLFASQREAVRWRVLQAKQANGEISHLARQVPFVFELNGFKICEYRADFLYREPADGPLICEDSKGVSTAMFRLKAKMLRAFHGVTVVEV